MEIVFPYCSERIFSKIQSYSLSSRGMAWCVKTNCVNSLALSIWFMRSIMSSLSLIREINAVQLEALVPKPALVIFLSSKFATVVAAEFVVDL